MRSISMRYALGIWHLSMDSNYLEYQTKALSICSSVEMVKQTHYYERKNL